MQNKELEKFIFDLMEIQNQIKIYHWQTKMYGKHKALDELFDELVDKVDEIAEIGMGKYDRVDATGITFTFKNFSDADLNGTISTCINICIDLKLDSSNDSDILNLRDELLGKLNQTKYLLTLK